MINLPIGFIAAVLVMIFGMDIIWWQAILVCFLATLTFTVR